MRLARVAASKARNPKRAMSSRRFGATDPSPPRRMAMEEKFAKPHRAKVMV